jgi:uncharacterized protein (TIGR00255 family)
LTIASMTGFARTDGTEGPYAWVWELRSVNGRGLEVRCRLPNGFERLDPVIRNEAPQRLKRGNLSVTLSIGRNRSNGRLSIDPAILGEVLDLQRQLSPRVDSSPPRIEVLLSIPGVVDRYGLEAGAAELTDGALVPGFRRALAQLAAAREDEGRRLAVVLGDLLNDIEELIGQARETAPLRPDAVRERIAAQLALLLESKPPIAEERLGQELALLAVKADIREELDRLSAHLGQARQLLDDGGAVGRRLDFLTQEFNREANTLCAKSSDLVLTRIGVELKTAIDRLREQIQNIE